MRDTPTFVHNVQREIGCSIDDAYRVLKFYKRHKLVKLDARCNGTYNVVHGAFWEKDVLRRALEAADD